MIRRSAYIDAHGDQATLHPPMSWKFIRLELASTGEFPAGSVGRAYLIRLPLDDRDHVDTVALDSTPHRATFRRHWSAEPDEHGQITQHGQQLQMGFNGSTRILRIDDRPVRLGEQVSVEDDDGAILPFRIASIR